MLPGRQLRTFRMARSGMATMQKALFTGIWLMSAPAMAPGMKARSRQIAMLWQLSRWLTEVQPPEKQRTGIG